MDPVTSDAELRMIYEATRTIAVVGASSDPAKAGNSIPAYLQSQGFRILPVSPKGGELFGEKVATSLGEIDQEVDVVDVFRPAEETPAIARDAVAIGAKVLWLQAGIFSEEAAEIARKGGLSVVMDMCMGVTHQRLGLGPGP
jgi:uncharacterized protein